MLRWQNQWGTQLKNWKKQYDEGREPPRQFFEQPQVDEHLQEHWVAFYELGSERQLGMGVGPIPRSKLKAYVAEELGLAGDSLEQFCAVLRRVDEDYVLMMNSTKTASKNKPSEIPADDVEGMTALFGRLEGQQKRKAAVNGHSKV